MTDEEKNKFEIQTFLEMPTDMKKKMAVRKIFLDDRILEKLLC